MRKFGLSACAAAVSCLVLLGLGGPSQVFSEGNEGDSAEAKTPSPDPDGWTNAVAGLIQVLKAGRSDDARKAAAILGSIGRSAVPQRIKVLSGDDESARFHALYALGEMGRRATDRNSRQTATPVSVTSERRTRRVWARQRAW